MPGTKKQADISCTTGELAWGWLDPLKSFSTAPIFIVGGKPCLVPQWAETPVLPWTVSVSFRLLDCRHRKHQLTGQDTDDRHADEECLQLLQDYCFGRAWKW